MTETLKQNCRHLSSSFDIDLLCRRLVSLDVFKVIIHSLIDSASRTPYLIKFAFAGPAGGPQMGGGGGYRGGGGRGRGGRGRGFSRGDDDWNERDERINGPQHVVESRWSGGGRGGRGGGGGRGRGERGGRARAARD